MARADRLASGPAPCCGGCDGDCGGMPVFPLAPRARRRSWLAVLQVLVALLVAFALGTLGCAFFDSMSAHAQQIQTDTSTTQYKQNQGYVDSLVAGPILTWVKRFRLPNWKIIIQADTLSIETAETYINETYKNTLIRIDVRRMRIADIDEVIVHELFHVKLSPYTAFVTNYVDGHGEGIVSAHLRLNEERLVTDLTRTLLWRSR